MSHKTEKPPLTVTELSHRVRDALESEVTEETRMQSMDLCQEIMRRHDVVSSYDNLLRETLRGWVGKVQRHFGNQG